MRPILFAFSLPWIGEIPFPSYLTLLFLGLLLALMLTVRDAPKQKLDPYRIYNLNLYMIAFGLLGARLLHLIADGHFHEYVNLCLHPERVPAFKPLVNHCFTAKECGFNYLCDPIKNLCHPPQDCFAFAKFWNGGLAYYGGFLLATVVAFLYCRRHKMPFLRVADLAAPAIMLGLFCGRVGCFLNGCCFGKITQSFFGIRFPIYSLPWDTQLQAHLIHGTQPMFPVHPTQLYEAFGCLLVFAILYFFIRPKNQTDGRILGIMMILYAIVRSTCEIFRDDERGVFFGWLSTSQIISIPLLLLGLYLCVRKSFQRAALRPNGQKESEQPVDKEANL